MVREKRITPIDTEWISESEIGGKLLTSPEKCCIRRSEGVRAGGEQSLGLVVEQQLVDLVVESLSLSPSDSRVDPDHLVEGNLTISFNILDNQPEHSKTSDQSIDRQNSRLAEPRPIFECHSVGLIETEETGIPGAGLVLWPIGRGKAPPRRKPRLFPIKEAGISS